MDTTSEAARERWAALPARERAALIRAVRRGERVAEPDRALAVTLADRELDRVARVVRPRRLLVWRALHALVAVGFALRAGIALAGGSGAALAVYGALAAVFGSSALLARRRLDRQVARLAAARAANAPENAARV